MNPLALQYHYAVEAGQGTHTFTDWLPGKRVQRIAITCAVGTTARLDIFLINSPPTTPYHINIASGEKLVLNPEGTATAGDIGIQVTSGPTAGCKWAIEAWEPA